MAPAATGCVPYGVSRRSYAAIVRRARTPTTPAQHAHALKRAAAMVALRRAKYAKTCGRGHHWTEANTYYSVRLTGPQAGQRTRLCKACQQVRRGRLLWERRVVAARLERLRLAMLNAHPDKGGTSRKFIKARRAYLAALKRAA